MRVPSTIQTILGRLRTPVPRLVMISEQRVGSRWVRDLLIDLYWKQASPEWTRRQHLGEEREATLQEVQKRFKRNQIVKFHHTTPHEIFGSISPLNYKVIGVVRNPRDRGVSVAFHHMYDYDVGDWPQKGMTEEEAIRFTIRDYPRYPVSNARQLDLMLPGHSTRTWDPQKEQRPYMWTCYEWLKLDVYREMARIAEFIGTDLKKSLADTIEKQSFAHRAGRTPGQEQRDDVRRRKGVVGDWQNWFDAEMLDATQDIHEQYYLRLESEEDRSDATQG